MCERREHKLRAGHQAAPPVMLVLTGLLRFVIKLPDSIVFDRILPALGLMLCLSTFYYAFLAYRLAQKTDRNDVCALPSGVSVPHMFIVTFVIMLPITLATGDPIAACGMQRRKSVPQDPFRPMDGGHATYPTRVGLHPRRSASALVCVRFQHFTDAYQPRLKPCQGLGIQLPW
jgi:hypothetical protein